MHTDLQVLCEHRRDLLKAHTLGVEFGDVLDAGVDVGYPVPCGCIDDARGFKSEDLLERAHCRRRSFIENAVSLRNLRDCWIVARNAVEEDLQRLHIVSCRTHSKVYAAERWHIGAYRGIPDYVDVLAVVILEYLIGRVATVCESDRAPL